MRSNAGVIVFINFDKGLEQIIELVEETRDEEVNANAAKILRICLREEIFYDKVSNNHPKLGDLLLK